MPPPNHPKHPPAPQPTRILFDPFNSSSTGHQRAENRLSGSTSWRDSRTHKLAHQFRDHTGGGGKQHLSDLVGAGSEHFSKDGRKENGDWEVGAPGLRESGWQDIRELMSGNRKRGLDSVEEGEPDECELGTNRGRSGEQGGLLRDNDSTRLKQGDLSFHTKHNNSLEEELSTTSTPPPQIFRNLTMYLNGSTAPLISDHKLKHVFAQHGGNTSIALGRRTVTHVILGDELAGGGGLSSRKIQKEVALTRGLGKGVKYVTAQWVVDSVQKGVRQPEARYVPKAVEGRLGGSAQGSVRGMFMPKTK